MTKIVKIMIIPMIIGCLFACTLTPGGVTPVLVESTSIPLPTVTTIPEVTPTNTPEGWGTVSIVSSQIFTDSYNDYIVAGMIFNGTDQPVGELKMSLKAADSAGNTVLEEYSGGDWVKVEQREVSRWKSDMVSETIPPGDYAPFYTVINSGTPATYSIEMTSYKVVVEDIAVVKVENEQMFTDGEGNFFISGELVNTEAFGVKVEEIFGAVLDEAGEVWGAGEAWAYGGYLLPAGDPSGLDRAPFSVKIFGPMKRYSGFSVHPLATSGEPSDDLAYTTSLTHTFVDTLDRFHVIAEVVSGTTTQIASPEVLASLYDENGKVIDVHKLYSHPSLKPGEHGYADVFQFAAISAIPELVDRVVTARVQINPENIYDVSAKNVLAVQGVKREYSDFGPSWYFTGWVVNTTSEPLGGATVMVVVRDAEKIPVGTFFAYVNPDDKIAAGGLEDFSLTVFLDPALDLATLTYEIVAWDD